MKTIRSEAWLPLGWTCTRFPELVFVLSFLFICTPRKYKFFVILSRSIASIQISLSDLSTNPYHSISSHGAFFGTPPRYLYYCPGQWDQGSRYEWVSARGSSCIWENRRDCIQGSQVANCDGWRRVCISKGNDLHWHLILDRISGIQFAHDVTTRMENYELNIYEKNSDLGGTWFENKYPG